jgi:hypothetical protein
LAGQRLEVIFERRRAGAELVLVCEGGDARTVTLPVAWTDRVAEALSHRLGAEGLVELAGLVAVLGDPPLAKRGRS